MNQSFTGKMNRHADFLMAHMHLIPCAIAACFSLVCFFLPTLSLSLFSIQKMSISLLSVLQYREMQLSIADATYTLSFTQVILPLILTLIIPLSLLALIALYERLLARINGQILSAILFFLLLADLISYLQIPSKLIDTSVFAAASITQDDLFFSVGTLGNFLIVILIIGLFAAAFGATGVKARLRMFTYPYFIWLIVFTILPLLLICFAAFFVKSADGSGYSFSLDGLKALAAGQVNTKFYGISLHMQEYFSVFLRSLDYAVWTTIGCLLVAYPLAYAIAARSKRQHAGSSLLLMFFVLPMWINTMLRTYAWRAFFAQTGVLNTLLLNLHMISEPILFLKMDILSDLIIKLVLVNDFLPFMLLPIYAVLVKLDENVRQAAHDLGANSFQTFSRVTFPLSMPGVISGIQMVFMPSLTFYMIPDIISEGSVTTIGNSVQTFILSESPVSQQAGNVLSLLLLIFVLITMGILRNADKDSGGGGMIL